MTPPCTIITEHRTGPANILTDYPEFNRAFRQGLAFLEGHEINPQADQR